MLAPGTYSIHDTDSKHVLSYYVNSEHSHKVGVWEDAQKNWQKASTYIPWHVKRYPWSFTYAIQSVQLKRYIAINQDGNDVCGVEEDGAAILELEHLFQDFYLVKLRLRGTEYYLERTNIGAHHLVSFAEKTSLQDWCWRFEKINEDTGGILKPKSENSTPIPEASQSNNILLPNKSSLYTDDAHFHTDMLFNMPRTPFVRTQRIAALDWARKLGAANVPTIESFEECEKRLEATGHGR